MATRPPKHPSQKPTNGVIANGSGEHERHVEARPHDDPTEPTGNTDVAVDTAPKSKRRRSVFWRIFGRAR